MGPLFFLLYVNDMVRACVGLEVVLFADDTTAFAEGRNSKELADRAKAGLEELSRWFRCNKLTLNLKKTEYILFKRQGSKDTTALDIKIGCESIKRVGGAKFLGVWVDEELKWTAHIERVRTKASQLLGVIGRAKDALGGQAVRTLYNSLILPHLQYCLIVWGDFVGDRNKTLASSLATGQNKLLRMVTGRSRKCHTDPLFAECNLLKINDVYRQQLRVHAWQFWNGWLPENQAAMFQRVEDTHGYSTRAARNEISRTRDTNSIAYRVPKEWASLPDSIKEARALTAFKNQSKRQMIRQYENFDCVQAGCRICQGEREGEEE